MPNIIIPDRFVDVNFPEEATRLGKGTGDIGVGLFGSQPVFEDSIQTIPEDEWKPRLDEMDAEGGGLERMVTRVYNQGQEGACVSNATGQAHELIQGVQYGLDKIVHLSAISLYKRCGRSAGSGSTVSGNLSEMNSQGILPLNNAENQARFKHTMPNTGFNQSYPAGWQETAMMFRGMEWFDIRTTSGLITALLLQYPVVVGRQGHSICYIRPMYRNGSLGVAYVNSWGNWGFGLGNFTYGFGFDSWSLVRQSASWAFALRAVKITEDIPDPPLSISA